MPKSQHTFATTTYAKSPLRKFRSSFPFDILRTQRLLSGMKASFDPAHTRRNKIDEERTALAGQELERFENGVHLGRRTSFSLQDKNQLKFDL